MNITALLDGIPFWGLILVLLVISGASMELGHRLGRRGRQRLGVGEEAHPGPLVTASFSLLAFTLAVVFGSVVSRLQESKQVALDEANAIGTTFTRADLLPEPDRTEVRRVLQEYVDMRLRTAADGAPQPIDEATERSEGMQTILWSRAAAQADQRPTPTTALFVSAVNEVMDLHEKRITLSLHYRVPGVVWQMLLGLTVLAFMIGGYATALSGNRRLLTIPLSAALAFSVVLATAVALDRPHAHLSGVTQSAMLDLQESMRHSIQAE